MCCCGVPWNVGNCRTATAFSLQLKTACSPRSHARLRTSATAVGSCASASPSNPMVDRLRWSSPGQQARRYFSPRCSTSEFEHPTVSVSGREGGIRTRDLSVPNRARYQASLLPDVLNFLLDVRCTRFLGPEPSALPD